MTETPAIEWPERLTISLAKQLAKKINAQMGIGHSRALHAIAVRYGFKTWIACRQALETEVERAEKLSRDMSRQQHRARKWAEGNAQRREITDALAAAEPGWIGQRTATASLDPGLRPADATAAAVVLTPHKE